MSLLWPTLAAVAWALVVAIAGGKLTRLDDWYRRLKRPRLQPPDWAFGPAWTIIFALCVTAAVLAWRDAPNERARFVIVALYLLNGALNVFWNLLFFWRRRPDHALVEVVALWLSILAPIIVFWPFSPTASLLLAPYLLWVGFAGYLNREIVRLNKPFGSAAEAPRHVDGVRDA